MDIVNQLTSTVGGPVLVVARKHLAKKMNRLPSFYSAVPRSHDFHVFTTHINEWVLLLLVFNCRICTKALWQHLFLILFSSPLPTAGYRMIFAPFMQPSLLAEIATLSLMTACQTLPPCWVLGRPNCLQPGSPADRSQSNGPLLIFWYTSLS